MKKSAAMLEEIGSRLREQAVEMASLRAALDIQFKRIAEMQAELDRLPSARRRRQALNALLSQPPSHNGRRHT